MRALFFIFSLALFAGCGDQGHPRQYTEVVSQAPAAPAQQTAMEQKAPDNPHAGLNMGSVTPEARSALQKMLAEGQDPHAGIDMSAFGGKDPHAGLDMPGIGNGAVTPSPYTWVLPKNWKQGPNKGAMRLASFYLEGKPDAIDCYIVSLPGMAGGLEANLKRWMGQVNIQTTDTNYQKLVDTALTIPTQGGLQAKFYDLMSLQQGPSDKSMIAAIVSTGDTTIFVKMTGSSDNIKENRDAYLELLKSLAVKQ